MTLFEVNGTWSGVQSTALADAGHDLAAEGAFCLQFLPLLSGVVGSNVGGWEGATICGLFPSTDALATCSVPSSRAIAAL
jgi:hypothetical protein